MEGLAVGPENAIALHAKANLGGSGVTGGTGGARARGPATDTR